MILVDSILFNNISAFFIQKFNRPFKNKNEFCIPESINTKISQLFDYKITFVYSQHKNSNSKGDFVLKNGLKRSFKRFLVYKNKLESKYEIEITLATVLIIK